MGDDQAAWRMACPAQEGALMASDFQGREAFEILEKAGLFRHGKIRPGILAYILEPLRPKVSELLYSFGTYANAYEILKGELPDCITAQMFYKYFYNSRAGARRRNYERLAGKPAHDGSAASRIERTLPDPAPVPAPAAPPPPPKAAPAGHEEKQKTEGKPPVAHSVLAPASHSGKGSPFTPYSVLKARSGDRSGIDPISLVPQGMTGERLEWRGKEYARWEDGAGDSRTTWYACPDGKVRPAGTPGAPFLLNGQEWRGGIPKISFYDRDEEKEWEESHDGREIKPCWTASDYPFLKPPASLFIVTQFNPAYPRLYPESVKNFFEPGKPRAELIYNSPFLVSDEGEDPGTGRHRGRLFDFFYQLPLGGNFEVSRRQGYRFVRYPGDLIQPFDYLSELRDSFTRGRELQRDMPAFSGRFIWL